MSHAVVKGQENLIGQTQEDAVRLIVLRSILQDLLLLDDASKAMFQKTYLIWKHKSTRELPTKVVALRPAIERSSRQQ